ncbi:DUF2390 domain-containing protein [Shewanella sp. A25]|nr:DUF2390 domain-containing protein [Shewanella shenzhenensis]
MENKPLDNQVWQWGDDCYAKNQTLCLMLQDSYAVNVNLLLLALYLDNKRTGARTSADASSKQASSSLFSSKQWQTLITGVMEWDDKLIIPYRRLRRLAKDRLNPAEYQQMLAVELMLERKAQRIILQQVNALIPEASQSFHNSQAIQDSQANPTSSQTNLASYLSLFGMALSDIEALAFTTSV